MNGNEYYSFDNHTSSILKMHLKSKYREEIVNLFKIFKTNSLLEPWLHINCDVRVLNVTLFQYQTLKNLYILDNENIFIQF